MNQTEKSKLEEVFQNTDYIVQLPDRPIIIRIGEYNPALYELLKVYQSRTWAFITACNPFSRLLSDQENSIRQSRLEKRLAAENYHFLNGCGQDREKKWQGEPSFFITDINWSSAVSLGAEFEQHAIVWGDIENAPALVWCQNS